MRSVAPGAFPGLPGATRRDAAGSVVGAIAGVILTSLRGTEARLGAQIKDLRGEVGDLRERMAHEISELRERMAHLEGLLEGLREAITGRAGG